MSKQTLKQRRALMDAILAFVNEFWYEEGSGPLVTEICLGVRSSLHKVNTALRILEERGEITWDHDTHRSIRAVEITEG